MKERPILFSAPMVRAILEGRKTQTRRVVAQQPTFDRRGVTSASWAERDGLWMFPNVAPEVRVRCPYGQPGDRLYVRETWARVNSECGPGFAYRADGDFHQPDYDGENFGAGPSFNYAKYPGDYSMWYGDLLRGADGHPWSPSIHMPRWASRIDLEVTGVRVERLQDISEEDADCEGVLGCERCNGVGWINTGPDGGEQCDAPGCGDGTLVDLFRALWESINGPGSWDANPWVWVVEFRRVKA